MLESHEVELPGDTDKEKTKKSKVLKNTKKTLNWNRDFRCITNNLGKGKRLGLRSIQDEEEIECHNKEEIEEKVMMFDEMHFIKVKESKVHEDKICDNFNKDDLRDKILSGKLNREDCNEKNLCKFLKLLERRRATQIGNTNELTEEEFKKW